jgi:hypothetical protein
LCLPGISATQGPLPSKIVCRSVVEKILMIATLGELGRSTVSNIYGVTRKNVA